MLSITSLAFSDTSTTKEQIAQTKAEIAKLQAQLQELEASLPKPEKSAEEKRSVLVTHAEFGFAQTEGNTNTKSYSLDMDMKKSINKHNYLFSFDGEYADDQDVETKNKYLTELQYDFDVTKRFALNYLAGFKQDRFSGYKYQSYTGPGAKYKFIVKEKHNLSVEGNILYSQDEKDDKTQNDYTSLRTKGIYEWQVLKNLKFIQELSYRTEVEKNKNYFIYSKSAFTSKISDMLSFGINYKIDYVNLPATTTAKHTDKALSANLIADF